MSTRARAVPDLNIRIRNALTGRPGVTTIAYGVPRCTCHWVGRRRRWRWLAIADALTHAAESGCTPGLPLVVAR